MKDILQNLALIELNTFGKANGLDISGTHAVKDGRGFRYNLIRNDTGLAILTVIFHKHQVPTHIINRNA